MNARELAELRDRVARERVASAPRQNLQLQQRRERRSLTPREIEVMERIAAGEKNPEIAQSLYISEETVKSHMRRITDVLRANNRAHAVAICFRRGLLSIEQDTSDEGTPE